ncbi:unnamed protein product [Mesocestoides corti]|uniref:BHLH domain-containing protein n=1 Tax=Mesocestoides corti TaxID=53468 RepID=A0A0R3U1J0_MESCO|nr:unnamed protein product [Mesocestoides corti]
MDRYIPMPQHQHQPSLKPLKKRGRKPGVHSSVVQRNAANARERSRMRVLSTAFVELKSVLPWVPKDTKLSKLDTLKLASGYITYLKQILDAPEEGTQTLHTDSLLGTVFKGSAPKAVVVGGGDSPLQRPPVKKTLVEFPCLEAPTTQPNVSSSLKKSVTTMTKTVDCPTYI